jgi:hypothetical protein
LVDIVNTYFDAAAIRERADLQEMDRPCRPSSAAAPHHPATAMSDETILGNPRNHRETNGE